MIDQLKCFLHGIRTSFKLNPLGNIMYLLINILYTSLSIYISVAMGEIIDNLVGQLNENASLSEFMLPIFVFILMLILFKVLVVIRWRFNDDILPLKGRQNAYREIIKISEHIPIRDFDSEEFHVEYSKFSDGYISLVSFLPSISMALSILYGFVFSGIVLFRLHFTYPIVTVVFLIVAILLNLGYVGILNDLWERVHKITRKATYLSSLFINKVSNRDIRILDLKNKFISDFLNVNQQITNLKMDGRNKTDKPFAIYISICENLSGIIAIGISLYFIYLGMLEVGVIYVSWKLVTNSVGNAQNAQRAMSDLFLNVKKHGSTFSFYDKYTIFTQRKTYNSDFGFPNDASVVINNLSYKYNDAIDALNDVSIIIKKGEKILLVGENGSGKSTLVKCILGLYEPSHGTISIFGQDPFYASDDFIRDNVSIMFQDYCTYPFTLRENIGFGDISKIDSENLIIDALRCSNAGDMIDNLDSLDVTLKRELSDEGVELSVGQWQKIAIARSFLRKRNLMIFDEPTSSLDPIAEVTVLKSLQNDLGGATAIIISHRVGFARLADRILVMDKGKIVEDGNHEYLLSLDGVYARMYNAQSKWYDLEDY